jgi:hypothetical protein
VSVSKTVIWGSEPPREHLEYEWDSPKVNVWYVLTHERVIGPYFFDEDIITRSSFIQILENYALLQLKNNNLLLKLDGIPVHFAHIICGCLNVNFPGRCLGRGGPVAWPPHSRDFMPLDVFLWGYVKDQVYSQRVTRGGMYAELQITLIVKCSTSDSFSASV